MDRLVKIIERWIDSWMNEYNFYGQMSREIDIKMDGWVDD